MHSFGWSQTWFLKIRKIWILETFSYHIFLALNTYSKKWNFDNFCLQIFRNIAKISFCEIDNVLWNWEFFDSLSKKALAKIIWKIFPKFELFEFGLSQVWVKPFYSWLEVFIVKTLIFCWTYQNSDININPHVFKSVQIRQKWFCKSTKS